ncbi:ANTH domain-containing protein [Scheffersomyces coipomensis]|uniref:ANTH domain-containing protein n=1 Tax=Scheffersomyces coipomensis TaxID=1788519 RepID=UPI00315CEDCB
MTTYEKIVKGATKVKVAAPKPKYIEPILMATSTDLALETENLHTIMKTLQYRLQDSAWSVVYKSLIVIHIMIREGDKDVTLNYLVQRYPQMLNLSQSNISKGSGLSNDVKFIIKYAKYLQQRVKQFESTGIDYVRDERSSNNSSQQGGRLRTLSIDKGLLRETESIQKQIDALLKNNFMENEINNDIILTAFRLLVNDLLALFQELNEGVINILEHYFEMSKVDAERALKIYKKFVDQTKYVIDYLRVAKHLENATKLHVPTIKHAPTALTSSLEEYLDDPNYEANRRQYLAEKQGKENGNGSESKPESSQSQQQQQQPQPIVTGLPDQQPSNPELQRNNTLIVRQSTYNPWGTIAVPEGFAAVVAMNGYQNQPQQQVQVQPQQVPVQQQQPQVFQSHTGGVFTTLPTIAQGQPLPVQQPIQNAFTGFGNVQQLQPQHTNTNPFLQAQQQPVQQQQQQQPIQQQQTFQSQVQPYQPFSPPQQQQPQQFAQMQRTGSNPFARVTSMPTGQQPLQPQSTNPFAQSRFASSSHTTAFTFNNNENNEKPKPIQASATGNNPFKLSQTTTNLFNSADASAKQRAATQPQLKPQATAGGLEHIPTIAVFPETQRDQQKEYFLNNARVGIQQQMTSQFQPQVQPQYTSQQVYQRPAQSPPVQGQPQQQQQFQQFQSFGQAFPQQQFQPQVQAQPQVHHYDGPSLI